MKVLILLTSHAFLNEGFHISLQALPKEVRFKSMGCFSDAQMAPKWGCMVLEQEAGNRRVTIVQPNPSFE